MHKIKLENGKFKFVESYTGLDGKRHRVSVTKSNQTRATEKQAYQELQKKISTKLKNNSNRPLGYYIDKFLEFKKYMTPNTVTMYKLALSKLDREILLDNLTKIHIEDILQTLRITHSINTIKNFNTIYNTLFNYIREYHTEEFKVKSKITITKEEKISLRSKIKFIDTQKIDEVLSQIKNPRIRDFAIVQLHTGLRIGELLALTDKDIDWDNNIISINKTRHRDGSISAPKTLTSHRKIEISNYVKNVLLNNLTSDKQIFSMNYFVITQNLGKIKLSSHMFRHTHVALLVEQGVPIKVISERMGHADISTTLNIYTHITQNMKVNLRSKLEKLGTF